jgi:mRNA interferase HicA
MKYSEFRRWLKKQGCTFKNHEGGSGHVHVIYKGKIPSYPLMALGKN